MRKRFGLPVGGAYALGIAAIILSLVGSAVALQGKNTVNSGDVINESLKGKDLKSGTIATQDLADGSVTTPKIANNAVNGEKVAESTLGAVPNATNATTAATATNATTAATATKLGSVTVQREEVPVPGNGTNALTVLCPDGQQAIGGGARAVAYTTWLVSSRPDTSTANPEDGESFTGWRAAANNTVAAADTLHVWVICAG